MEFPLVGLRWNIYPRWIDQNVQDLDVGQLELFLRCLNVKYARRLQNFTNASHSLLSAMFVFHNPVLSLARPNFLTGAIIETRFQASLLTPPGVVHFTHVCLCIRGRRKFQISKFCRVNCLLNEAKLSPVAKRKMVATILS